ncbi:hypothetical protein HGRIS_000758 [Hohenbuehelia grisea]|uniref:Uncharacterized protein n=1 Tax=Hohenbuehelia grisea TaxID=104357 RepID=A0ABR3IPM7_9AGAR
MRWYEIDPFLSQPPLFNHRLDSYFANAVFHASLSRSPFRPFMFGSHGHAAPVAILLHGKRALVPIHIISQQNAGAPVADGVCSDRQVLYLRQAISDARQLALDAANRISNPAPGQAEIQYTKPWLNLFGDTFPRDIYMVDIWTDYAIGLGNPGETVPRVLGYYLTLASDLGAVDTRDYTQVNNADPKAITIWCMQLTNSHFPAVLVDTVTAGITATEIRIFQAH